MYTRVGPLLTETLDREPEAVAAELWLRFPPSFSADEREEFALAWIGRTGSLVNSHYDDAQGVLRIEGPRRVVENLIEDPLVLLAMAPKAERDAAGIVVPELPR
jgi:hypothetical protein